MRQFLILIPSFIVPQQRATKEERGNEQVPCSEIVCRRRGKYIDYCCRERNARQLNFGRFRLAGATTTRQALMW